MTSLQTQEPMAVSVPTAGRWQIDQAHSSVSFAARHLGLSLVRGRFNGFAGAIELPDDPAQGRVEAVLEASSIDTGFDMRDGHLRSPAFLDVDAFNELTFVSTSVQGAGRLWSVTGDLTIRGITKPVTLEATYHGELDDPMLGTRRMGISAHLEIDREDFGLGVGGPVPGMVGKTIAVDIEAEALLDNGEPRSGS